MKRYRLTAAEFGYKPEVLRENLTLIDAWRLGRKNFDLTLEESAQLLERGHTVHNDARHGLLSIFVDRH